MTLSQRNKKAINNPWVWGLLIAFVIFFVANIRFIYLAFDEGPNLISDNAYELGKRYSLQQTQAVSPWQIQFKPPPTSYQNQIQLYQVELNSIEQQTLTAPTVHLYAYRPSDAKADFNIELKPVQDGAYQAQLAFPLPGNWDLIIEAIAGDNKASKAQPLYVQILAEDK